MSEPGTEKFSCASCGKTFRWKPEIAGKKGKCSCGAVFVAPASLAKSPAAPAPPKPKIIVKPTVVAKAAPKTVVAVAPVAVSARPAPVAKLAKPPPPPPKKEETSSEGDGLYDLVGLVPSEEAIAAASREVVAPAVAVAAPSRGVLEYQRAPKAGRSRREPQIDPNTGELADPMRNYFVPLIFLALGVALLGGYIFRGMGMGPLGEVVFGVAAIMLFAWTLIETIVMTLAAFPMATYCDVGLGLLRSAVLKFAGVIILSETLLMWLQFTLATTGVIPRRISFEEGFLWWVIYAITQTLIFHACFCYVFRIPASMPKFAIMMALVSRLCNWFLTLILVGLAISWAANRAASMAASTPTVPGSGGLTYQQVPVSQIPPPPLTAPASNTPTTQPGPTPMDARVNWLIHQPRSGVQDAYAWVQAVNATQASRYVISQMYAAGAIKVWVAGLTMIVQLPDDPDKRAACFDVSRDYNKKMGLGDMPANMTNRYQYMLMSLAPSQFLHKN